MRGPELIRIAGTVALCAGIVLLLHGILAQSSGRHRQDSFARTDSGPSAALSATAAKAALPRKPPSARMHLYTNWRTYTTRNGLPSNEAKCIRVYGSRVWVGTDNGLACYEGGRWRTYGVEDGLPHRVVMALDVSAQTGDLWVGTAGGVSRFSGGRFENFNQMNSGLANDLVYGISCYEEDVWIATASGVSRYNTRTREWEIFNNNNTIMFEPWCYAISARDDMVYVGVWGGGVVEYSYRTGYWKDYHDPDGELEICLFRDAGVVHEVIPAVSYENGILWAGSYFGLSTYDGKRWKNYFKKDSGLPSDFINFVRAQGSVGWICTDDGLSSFDGTTWFTYRKAGGGGEVRTHRGANLVEKRRLPTLLSHNYVLGVDFQGENVWVATAQGVCLGKPGPQ